MIHSERIAVVTGGGSGIGKATALALAESGARVYVGDLRFAPESREAFASAGVECVTCDVRSVEQIRAFMDRATSATGTLDMLVNNAGIGMVKPITDVSEQDWDNCVDTNLKAAFFFTKFAIAPMQAAGGGSIVNVSSNAGLLPRAHDPVYSISKGALIALTKSLALCHSVDRIRINAVCPGPVEATGMMDADLAAASDPQATRAAFIAASPLAHAHARMIRPQEVAAAVMYFFSDAAAMVTGTALAIDGGKSLGVPPSM